MKILMIVSEMDGIVKTGGLADFAAALPRALIERGHDLRVILPMYKSAVFPLPVTSEAKSLYFHLNHSDSYGCLVHYASIGTVPVRLVEHHDFFSRDGIYGYEIHSYPDNALRYAFLSKAALESCLQEQWIPDIVHCNDWQTALAPYYLKEHYHHLTAFNHTRSLLTIHNGDFQGKTDKRWIGPIGIPVQHFTSELMEEYGYLNMLKCGIMCSDAINAVSPGYCQELLLPETSHNLWHYLNKREDSFSGILNGCDYTLWNPETDPFLSHHFSSKDLLGKGLCKIALQERMGLPKEHRIPLMGLVSRLTAQKGFDYLLPALERLLYEDASVQLALLGSGEPGYGSALHHLQHRYPHKMSFVNGYDNGLSHLIEAGSDFFMMPSLFEPCGLNQLYSLAYGTLPIIRETGGLKDTVVGLPAGHEKNLKSIKSDQPDSASLSLQRATGIGFSHPDSDSCYNGLRQAISLYMDNMPLYLEIQQRAMRQLFTWEDSSEKYEILYKTILMQK